MTAIDYIELPATNLALTKEFYTNVFGWAWIDYGPGYASLRTAGLEIALNGSAEVGRPHAPGAQNAVGPFVLFQTDSLESVEVAIRAAGGSIVSPRYAYPGGHRFHFADPSGNILGVYQSDEGPS
jgi:predicted enzyme related to lactoylglutathione lyase